MAATKFKGKNLSLLIGSTEVNADIRSVTFENEEADDDGPTFYEYTQGGSRTWTMTVEGISDYASGSFHSFLWANVGTDKTYVFKPYGNTTASASQPHYSGTLTVGAEPNLGGAAGEVWTFEYTFTLTGKPTRAPALAV